MRSVAKLEKNGNGGMSMNQPKRYLAVFALACVLLVFLLMLSPKRTPQTVSGKLLAQTLTQSLDGHRRYLNVQLSDGQTILVNAPPTTDCAEDADVVLIAERNAMSSEHFYRFKSCSDAR